MIILYSRELGMELIRHYMKTRINTIAIFDYNNRAVKIFDVKDIPAGKSIEEYMRRKGYDIVNYAWMENVEKIDIQL